MGSKQIDDQVGFLPLDARKIHMSLINKSIAQLLPPGYALVTTAARPHHISPQEALFIFIYRFSRLPNLSSPCLGADALRDSCEFLFWVMQQPGAWLMGRMIPRIQSQILPIPCFVSSSLLCSLFFVLYSLSSTTPVSDHWWNLGDFIRRNL